MEVLVCLMWLSLASAKLSLDSAKFKREDLIDDPTERFYVHQNNRNIYAGVKKKFRPHYHVSTPIGWLSYPAGFVFFQGQYHLFYQYHPYIEAWGPMHWGHIVSYDLVDWIHYPVALIPGEEYDKSGCLAGTAFVHKNFLTVMYTGVYETTGNTTHTTQNMAISADGVVFRKYLYNPVLKEPLHGVTINNPRVWKFRNTWYMLLGVSSSDGKCRLLLYTSRDLFRWEPKGTIILAIGGDMGYAWEVPDLFEIDGYNVLLLSVQGILTDGNRFRNLYQTGYVVCKFNYVTGKFDDLEVSTQTFNELDFGHDFYAAQTTLADDGRRLLIAWLGVWERVYEEFIDGWASMLTIVRELKITPEGNLLMIPAREMTQLRKELLEEAWYLPGESFLAGSTSFELIVNSTGIKHDASLTFEWNVEDRLKYYKIYYSSDYSSVSVDRGGLDGVRKADWSPVGLVSWRIFVDSSSIEVFCGNGEVVFSSRIYPPKNMRVKVEGGVRLHIVQYSLKRSIGFDRRGRKRLKDYFIMST